MSEAVVLGGDGMLAHAVEPAFRQCGWEVRRLGRDACDITDPAEVARAIAGARLVINCAAYTRVDRAESEPERAFAVNATGAGHVARAVASAGAMLIHVSTNAVFDGSRETPYGEDEAVSPIGVYGHSKQAGEAAVQASGAHAWIVRTGHLYGDPGAHFFGALLARARATGSVRVVTDQVVAPTWTRDLAAQMAVVAAQAPPGIYHATAAGAVSWCDAARAALRLAGLDATVEPITTDAYGSPAPRPRYAILAHGALERLGIFRMRPWDVALEEWMRTR